jgi:ABC-type phosphate transport system ATPase subunit
MDFISIKNLKKKLDGKEILKGINLNVNKGDILALVGPSGSGKSTLLRCINRLIEPNEGNIYFNDQNIKEISPQKLRRNIVLVHQESVMLPGSVFDNVSYGPSLIGEVDKSHLIKCIEDAGLSEDFLTKNAEKLSGGEKKRVAIARALALKPSVLLLDEPTSGVDPKKIKTVENNIISFSKKRKLTVLWVTHNIDQAIRISNCVANLKNGIVKEICETKDFKWEGAY